MSESYDMPPSEEPRTPSSEAWREVGRQFQELGDSLAQAFRTAWEDEETRRQLREMRTGLESMVNEVGKAIKDTAESPTGQQIRSDTQKAAESVRTAGEQAVQDVRPHLVGALKEVNSALNSLINRMEHRSAPDESTPPEAPGE